VDDSDLVWRILGLGAIAGARSMAAPAALSRAAERGDVGSLEGTPFAALGSPRVSTALRLFEIGEMFVDKLPVIVPSRTSLPPLLGRAVSGAFVGAVLFVSDGRRAAAGGVMGAVSAAAAAYATERLRLQIAERLGIPDFVVALSEDAIVLFGAARLLRQGLQRPNRRSVLCTEPR
jgi:uncharacterized membrane protein